VAHCLPVASSLLVVPVSHGAAGPGPRPPAFSNLKFGLGLDLVQVKSESRSVQVRVLSCHRHGGPGRSTVRACRPTGVVHWHRDMPLARPTSCQWREQIRLGPGPGPGQQRPSDADSLASRDACPAAGGGPGPGCSWLPLAVSPSAVRVRRMASESCAAFKLATCLASGRGCTSRVKGRGRTSRVKGRRAIPILQPERADRTSS
jgi:hypothetical protein